MSKYTIAVFVGSKGGVAYYRQAIPHSHIMRKYGDEFKIIFKRRDEVLAEDELKEVQMVHYCGYFEFTLEAVYRKHGIVIVLDKDDWWVLPQDHPRAFEWHMRKIWYHTEMSIAAADHVICTTDYLADKVTELNANVTVIPNAYDQEVEQYQQQDWVIDPDFVRFGWMGGNSHLRDVALMQKSFKKLDSELMMRGRFQLVMGGFSMNETDTTRIHVAKDGKQKKIKIPPYETIYGRMERLFTDNYSMLRGKHEYLKYLAKYSDADTIPMQRETYKRIWSKEVTQYCKGYNELDVVLAPLESNEFNKCKSQLKLIEAGVFGRPIIVSKVGPYLIDGLNEENCIFVPVNSANTTFHTAMRRFLLDPNKIKTMGAKLHELVKSKYDINIVNTERVALYKELIDKRNK